MAMIAKEKAKELVARMYSVRTGSVSELAFFFAKQTALIAVDEILASGPRYPNDVDWDDVGGAHQYYYEAQREEADKYWQEVKQEISSLESA